VVQVVEPTKHETLSSNPRTAKNKLQTKNTKKKSTQSLKASISVPEQEVTGGADTPVTKGTPASVGGMYRLSVGHVKVEVKDRKCLRLEELPKLMAHSEAKKILISR
jgi:hypothetical protein